MFNAIASSVFGSKNDRELKRMSRYITAISQFEATITDLEDAQLAQRLQALRDKHRNAGAALDTLLPECFALVREAGKRALSMRHFDVQMLGGIALHQGNIAEMPTGEGKTLAATLPAVLNALTGNGVHIVTVNDYLAKRDAKWMEPAYAMLGLTVGSIVSGQDHDSKKAAYSCDITYATNNELGFDYLRDNMALESAQLVQRGLNFAIIDEVDSILIDEARTPLVISGSTVDNTDIYVAIDTMIPKLTPAVADENGVAIDDGDFIVNEKDRNVELTEHGYVNAEQQLEKLRLMAKGSSLYDMQNLTLLHHITAGLRAHSVFSKDIDYIVDNNEIVIIDEHTGRAMPGRRWSEGLHQAIEAKERVTIQNESQTLASTSFQNYFRQYTKLSGMTGTADTEAFEFREIYNLDVRVIPPNQPSTRVDHNDHIYLTEQEKFAAVVIDIQDCLSRHQPVLVGTPTIEQSELLATYLSKAKISHTILNAKQHQHEAEVIANAGKSDTVTIATNMAGRGTDIVLGGNLQKALEQNDLSQHPALKTQWKGNHQAVMAAGGLHIIGTERHESRRIDNQLRGRSGRQGDPGSSRFYLSVDDSLMRLFASERIKNMMRSLGMPSGEPIEHRMVSNAIERAQRKVESRNFDMRKQLLEYDDIANEQRIAIYQQRNEIMHSNIMISIIDGLAEDVIRNQAIKILPPHTPPQQWPHQAIQERLHTDYAIDIDVVAMIGDSDDINIMIDTLVASSQQQCQRQADTIDEVTRNSFFRQVFLQVIDNHWKTHLQQMDYLRQGIQLRGYAQKNPKQEYKRESFELFQHMLETIKFDTLRLVSHMNIPSAAEVIQMQQQRRREAERAQQQREQQTGQPITRSGEKIGRNALCPCGSGKKYKYCHGKL